ncbi:MAG: hypothetical protein V4549_12625 [Bacteroidota bacterium]
MALNPVIRGKDNIYKHFSNTKHVHWKLYNALDMKSPISMYMDASKKSAPDALLALKDIIDVLDVSGVYVLDTYLPTPGSKDFFKPETSIPFSINESNTSNQQQQSSAIGSQTSGYTPEFGEHIKLIQENARLNAENKYANTQLADALEEQNRLKHELSIAEGLLDEWENENEDEEEEEEDNKKGMFGNVPPDMNAAIAKLITEKGGLVLENLFKPKMNPQEQTKTPEAPGEVSGTDQDLFNIVLQLKKHDPEIEAHLKKLLFVAEQMPDTFVEVLKNLDMFG